jgi:hypothetical protein
MSLGFLDTNNVPLPKIYRVAGVGGVPSNPFPIRFECRNGYSLWAIASDNVTVEARADGDTDWIDIVATPIDVSVYAPDTTDFEIRLTPELDDDYEISLLVTEDPSGEVVNGDDQLVMNGSNHYVLR